MLVTRACEHPRPVSSVPLASPNTLAFHLFSDKSENHYDGLICQSGA